MLEMLEEEKKSHLQQHLPVFHFHQKVIQEAQLSFNQVQTPNLGLAGAGFSILKTFLLW